MYSRASDQESCGWWRAIVKMIKVLDQSDFIFCLLTCWIRLLPLDLQLSHFQGDFHVVEYLGWETTYTEIVPSDR